MKVKKNSITKWLLVILAVLAIIAITLGIWRFTYDSIKFIPISIKNDTPVIVNELKSDQEKAVGTIIYFGIDSTKIEVLKNDLASKVIFNVTDSPQGVINIYSQDLLNRYPKSTATQKEIKKSDALNQKAILLTCSQGKGKITVMAWLSPNGLTSVQIEKENNF